MVRNLNDNDSHLSYGFCMNIPKTPSASAAAVALSVLIVSACGSPAEPPAASVQTRESASSQSVQEKSAASPRLVLTHDGGLTVFDAESLEPISEIPLEGFLRLSNTGDGRHLAVSAEGGFHLLDTGSWSEATVTMPITAPQNRP